MPDTHGFRPLPAALRFSRSGSLDRRREERRAATAGRVPGAGHAHRADPGSAKLPRGAANGAGAAELRRRVGTLAGVVKDRPALNQRCLAAESANHAA